MVKKILFFLLFCKFHALSLPVLLCEPTNSRTILATNSRCYTVPAPDSFRVTDFSTTYINLAWKATITNTNYTIVVFKQGTSNEWDSLYSISNISGLCLKVDGLEPGTHYLFKIYNTSEMDMPFCSYSVIDGITLILELTTQGRIPIDPTPVNCLNMDFINHKWVGFKISYYKNGNVVSNFFEFDPKVVIESDGRRARIKRTFLDHPIVAANQNRIWPTNFIPLVESSPSIRMGEIMQNGLDINIFGHVFVELNSNLRTVDICVANVPEWNNFYWIQNLVADKIAGLISQEEDRYVKEEKDFKFAVQSPFNEEIGIFFPENLSKSEFNISLINLNGEVKFEQTVRNETSQISIPTNKISPGFYILRLEALGKTYAYKVIKNN